MRKIHITRLATVAGVTGAIAVAAMAFASDQKSAPQAVAAAPATSSTVQFVNATPEMRSKIGNPSTQSNLGMRAYVDADTKALRAATQAELNEAAASSARVAAPAAAKRSAGFAAASASPANVQLANGSTMAVLDESHLAYAVATIGPDGKVKQACVEQQPDEKAALRTAVAMQGANRHEK